jgi:hypothetical protein
MNSLSELLDEVEPFMSDEDTYVPTEAGELYWSAFTLALEGEQPDHQRFEGLDARAHTWAWYGGAKDGKRVRESREAMELGVVMGRISDLCVPPSGLASHEKAAYVEGFGAGRAESDARTEATIDRRRAELGDDDMCSAVGFYT